MLCAWRAFSLAALREQAAVIRSIKGPTRTMNTLHAPLARYSYCARDHPLPMPGAVLRLAKQFKSLRRPPGSACRVQGRHARALSTAHADVPSLDLKYAKLGSSDLSVSEVCLGTMTFGEQNTEKEAHAQLSFARDAGVNFLDTAELYPVAPRPETQGLTSTYIGTWLKHQQRDKVVVGSKVAGRSVGLDWIPANRSVPRGKEAATRVDAVNIKVHREGVFTSRPIAALTSRPIAALCSA
ncbi:hypothetical protein CYMTET_29140 [Cymbomonas tetramitiformis]|uniref:NADP-dependent oxidoreductase domain-containing protein n=1 Tax=Cymbomonas tetramitiformis TaxID=36881 RepID=A0AAE0FLP2_9CHLO|nr:hypothetical protein CYMTET_29140 [Cymbomonas tetramitiformis]